MAKQKTQAPTGSRPAGGARRVALAKVVSAGGDAGLAPAAESVLKLLDDRDGSPRLSASAARTLLSGTLSRALALRRHHGRETHELGTAFIELYMRHADAALGAPSFAALVEQYWPDRLDDVYLYMLVARECTADDAEDYGYWKCLYGIRLFRRLGLASFAALEEHDFGTDERGRPIRFKTMRVRDVKALAEAKAPAGELAGAPEEKVGRAVLRVRSRAAKLQSGDPEFAALGVRVYLREGQVAVTVTSSGRSGAKVAQRFLEALWE